MKVSELIDALGLSVVSMEQDAEIQGYYCGDLLSWVIGRAQEGSCWFTIMSNSNVCAVAKLLNMACIVLCEGVTPDEKLTKTVAEQGVNLLISPLSVYETVKKLHV